MSEAAVTREERDALIENYYEVTDELVQLRRESFPGWEAKFQRVKKERITFHQEYFERLPRAVLSACPFCGEELERAFDPWGPDGFWWQHERAIDVEESHHEHFAMLQGAVSLNGLPPRGGRDEARVGPGIPFVVPHVLKQPGMVAVISTVPLQNGYTAHPVAYFSESPTDGQKLSIPWTRRTYHFRGEDGRWSWSDVAHAWDFDLAPWLSQEKLCWIAPGDAQWRVRRGAAGCPYLGLDGCREMQIIKGDRLRTEPAP